VTTRYPSRGVPETKGMLSSKETIRIYNYHGISININKCMDNAKFGKKRRKKRKKKASTNPDEETTTNKISSKCCR